MKSLLIIILIMCMVSCHKKDKSMTHNIISSNDSKTKFSVKRRIIEKRCGKMVSSIKFIQCRFTCFPKSEMNAITSTYE